VLLGLRSKAEFVDVVDDLAEIVAALDAVLYLPEDFADFVFDGVWAAGLLLETVEIGEELGVDEGDEVITSQGGVVVDLAVFGLRGSPRFPALGRIENVGVSSSFKGSFGRLVGLQGVEVFQKEEPRGLFRVVEFDWCKRRLSRGHHRCF